MFEIIKVIGSVSAIVIALIAYIPYLIAMFKGKNKPHLYTWISITLITAVVAYMQLIGGAGIGAIPTIIGAAIDVVILFFCFRYGTNDITFIDKVCLGISVAGIAAYALLYEHAIIALLIVTIAEIISFIPTFRKTYKDPYSESLPSYYLLLAKLSLILVALETYNLLTVSYSLLWIGVFIVFLSMVYTRRTQVKMNRRTVNSEDAPLI